MKFPPVLGKLHSAVPLWPFPLLSVALDLLLRTDPASSATRLLWYLGSMTWSLVTWQLLFGLSARICRWRPGLGRTVVVLFCALAALLTVVSLGFFMHFSAWPTSFALVHALGEPAESFGYIASGLAGPFGAAVVLLAIAYSWWWLRALRLPPPATRMTLFSLFLWLGFAVTAGAVNRHSSFMVPDASAQKTMIDALVNATLGGFHGRLLDAQRKPIPPAPPPLPYRPNIVFIVGESLSPQHMSLLGYGRDTTPELVALAGRDGAAGYASFAKAVSCGTATKVALPSLMTGLFPQRSPLELHTTPLVWHYAKAMRYQTAFVSAQSFTWNNMAGFFFDSGLDHVFDLERSGHPVVNSTGMDDALMMDEAIRVLHNLAQQQPFFLAVHFNGTHYPGFSHPEHRAWPLQDKTDGYDAAVRCMDVEIGRLLRTLDELQLSGSTLILLTSDHGSSVTSPHKLHRTESYFQRFLEVPLVFHAPPAVRAALGQRWQQLLDNRTSRVSLADVTPTLAEIAGADPGSPLFRPLLASLDGRSLLHPLPEPRPLVAVNTDEHYRWSRQGFAIIVGDRKLLHYDWLGSMLFDLQADPDEQVNLLEGSAMPDPARAAGPLFEETIRKSPVLSGIYQQ